MLCRKSRFVKRFHRVVCLLPACHDPEGGKNDEAPGCLIQPGQCIGSEKIFEEQGYHHIHSPQDEDPQGQEPREVASDGKKDPDDQYRTGQDLYHRDYDVHRIVSPKKTEDFRGFGGMGG